MITHGLLGHAGSLLGGDLVHLVLVKVVHAIFAPGCLGLHAVQQLGSKHLQPANMNAMSCRCLWQQRASHSRPVVNDWSAHLLELPHATVRCLGMRLEHLHVSAGTKLSNFVILEDTKKESATHVLFV